MYTHCISTVGGLARLVSVRVHGPIGYLGLLVGRLNVGRGVQGRIIRLFMSRGKRNTYATRSLCCTVGRTSFFTTYRKVSKRNVLGLRRSVAGTLVGS